MTAEEAASIVDGWISLSNVVLTSPTERHWRILSDLLPKSQARGPLIMDAHLAALAIEHGATLCTNDRDFLRFPGLKVEFPLQ
jgi:predicted nucleic acid-binding protein